MDAEALRQLGGGLFVLKSGQRHLGLEFGNVLFPFFAIAKSFHFRIDSELNTLSSFLGPTPTNQKIKNVFAAYGYVGKPDRDFLVLNKIADGIMRKDSTTAKLTGYEINRNKKISKLRYIVEQYFGLRHLHDKVK